ncbi:MAG TPA: hypothetical protein VLW85_02375 [Myxococcales bacterium]|nr:hypothetical protein [Myxococcales bacterium]
MGFQPGTQGDPAALAIEMDESAGLIDFTVRYKLTKGVRAIEDEKFVANDLACWHAPSSVGSKIECIAQEVVDRVLASQPLALEHAPGEARPAAAQAQQPAAPRVRLSGRCRSTRRSSMP